jgi:hypothetical protein
MGPRIYDTNYHEYIYGPICGIISLRSTKIQITNPKVLVILSETKNLLKSAIEEILRLRLRMTVCDYATTNKKTKTSRAARDRS